MSVDFGDALTEARIRSARSRAQSEIDAEALLTLIAEAADAGMRQEEIASVLRVSQPYVSKVVKRVRAQSAVASPSSVGRSPLDVARRYAARLISRADAVKALASWDYRVHVSGDAGEFDDIGPSTDLFDLDTARRIGFIEQDMYDEIVALIERR